MNTVIEIIGPPGIGKSSIYKAVCKKWKPKYNWIYQDALIVPKTSYKRNPVKWIYYRYKFYSGKKNSTSIPLDYGLRFIKSNEKLANLYWDHVSKVYEREIDLRFRSAFLLFNAFAKYQAILEKSSSKVCLIDEGFLQKSFLIHENEQFLMKFLDSYLSLIPLPKALIYVNAPFSEIIIDRLKKRKKIIASHLNKNDTELLIETNKWQVFFRILLEIIRKWEIEVLEVNGNNSIEKNSLIVKEFLEKIN